MGADESCNVSWPECWIQFKGYVLPGSSETVRVLANVWDFWVECDKSYQTFWPSFARVSGSYGFGNMIVEQV